MHPRLWAILPALTILLIALASSANAGLLFESGANGYSFVAPDGWVRIPQDDVDQLVQAAVAGGGNQSLRYNAAFQAREGVPFKFPYILVQLAPYKEQPDEEQMKELMTATAADANPTTEAPPTFDAATRTFDFTYETDIKDKGKAKGIARGYFGNKALITVHCLMEPSEFQYNEPRYKQVLDSFRFTSFMAYREKDPWYMTRMFRTGVGCGITLLFGGYILYSRRKSRIAFDAMDAVGEKEATADIRDGRPFF
jgi:hypothetical protein